MSAPGKRNMCLTLREKVDIINAINNGAARKKVMSEYQLPASTLSCIIRHQDQLLKRMEERATNPSSKRIRAVDSPELEEKMKEFVSECRRDGVALTGNLMLSKAREFAGELGLTNFRASNGWLYNFKKRQGFPSRKSKAMVDSLKTYKITKAKHSEEVDTEDSEQAKTTSESHKEKYDPMEDEDLIAVNVTAHERDALKLEALDIDDDQYDNNDIATDFVNAKEFDDAVDFDGATATVQNDTQARTSEAVNAGRCPGAVEDEFSCFGRYIAQALRAMPPRMSVLARSELQAALARVQMRCFKTDGDH